MSQNANRPIGQSMSMGVVVERFAIDNPWQDHAWRPLAVIPGAPPVTDWVVLGEGDGWVHYHAATLNLELFPKETDGYKVNLSQDPPNVYVVLRPEEEGESEHDVIPFLVTACPNEALDYAESGEEIVEGVPMPDPVVTWLQAFVDQHHVEVPFKKRKRDRHQSRDGESGRGRGGRDG